MCNEPGKQGGQATKDTSLAVGRKPDSSCAKTMDSTAVANHVSKQLEVKGEVEVPLVLTVDSLKTMKVALIKNYNIVCQSGAVVKDDSTCKGVLLKDILQKAKIKTSHKDHNFYIVARATDGYKATFSWGELFNNAVGDNTYVIFEENGMPIKEKGDMILICPGDVISGMRHVYWLKSIEVYKVN